MVELLAPAGNYKGFLGAIHAGADAVYLSGNQYGARAYADNFSEEEIIRAITYAHLFQRKVYLTVNTLLKEDEIEQLYTYLEPLCYAKLDGVIVQDIGVFQWIKRNFPNLELHCSTQMAITGVYGARRLKEMGASRIVVARELSLTEIECIKREVDIEIEMFVHGAMCYAYSGNCLFSSILGGRSGNRGRCAQPCRLPYQLEHISETEEYLLSLKDMCLLPHISSLLKAGIDSFKIEGRMKRPEYTAGVTAIYRKYIDLFLGSKQGDLVIQEQDLEYLSQLYIRSGLSSGYYERHNGSDMVTLDVPSYGNTSESLLKEIQRDYLETEWKIPITIQVNLQVGKPIQLKVIHELYGSVKVEGGIIQKAQNRPLEEHDIRKQMLKMGDTHFVIKDLTVQMEGNCFLPVKLINEVRRQGIIAMEREILSRNSSGNQIVDKGNGSVDTQSDELSNLEVNLIRDSINQVEIENQTLQVSIMTKAQLNSAMTFGNIGRIYIESDLFLEDTLLHESLKVKVCTEKVELFIKMPYILRLCSYSLLEEFKGIILGDMVQGVLVRNIETLQWLQEIDYRKEIILDSNMYCFNSEAIYHYRQQGIHIIVPYELKQSEIRRLPFSEEYFYCYGKIPMMISANCVHQTKKCCTKSLNDFVYLKDRYNKKLPVYLNCNYCYNVIYNTVPLSLHQSMNTFISKYKLQGILNFTDESEAEVKELISYFMKQNKEENLAADSIGVLYTKGHLKRGVE